MRIIGIVPIAIVVQADGKESLLSRPNPLSWSFMQSREEGGNGPREDPGVADVLASQPLRLQSPPGTQWFPTGAQKPAEDQEKAMAEDPNVLAHSQYNALLAQIRAEWAKTAPKDQPSNSQADILAVEKMVDKVVDKLIEHPKLINEVVSAWHLRHPDLDNKTLVALQRLTHISGSHASSYARPLHGNLRSGSYARPMFQGPHSQFSFPNAPFPSTYTTQHVPVPRDISVNAEGGGKKKRPWWLRWLPTKDQFYWVLFGNIKKNPNLHGRDKYYFEYDHPDFFPQFLKDFINRFWWIWRNLTKYIFMWWFIWVWTPILLVIPCEWTGVIILICSFMLPRL